MALPWPQPPILTLIYDSVPFISEAAWIEEVNRSKHKREGRRHRKRLISPLRYPGHHWSGRWQFLELPDSFLLPFVSCLRIILLVLSHQFRQFLEEPGPFFICPSPSGYWKSQAFRSYKSIGDWFKYNFGWSVLSGSWNSPSTGNRHAKCTSYYPPEAIAAGHMAVKYRDEVRVWIVILWGLCFAQDKGGVCLKLNWERQAFISED